MNICLINKSLFFKICMACTLTFSSMCAFSVTELLVNWTTGSDDLRSGNSFRLSFTTFDGRVINSNGYSSGSHSGANDYFITRLPPGVSSDEIRTLRVIHDGSPRSGNPFDTYDNWELQSLFVMDITNSNMIYDSNTDPSIGYYGGVARFSGDLRSVTKKINPTSTEPDLVLDRIRRTGSTMLLTIKNKGNVEAIVTSLKCEFVNYESRRSTFFLVAPGESKTISLAHNRLNFFCSVYGFGVNGSRERVTWNNGLKSWRQ